MNKLFALAGAAVLMGTGIVGCSNTADGASKDAANDTAAVKTAADTAATKTVEGAEKAGAAVEKGTANAAATTEKAAADAANGAQKAAADVANGAEKAVAKTGEVATHTGKVLKITPKVKAALLNDPTLTPSGNAGMNSFNVDTDSDGVTIHLKGHVQTNDMKKKAEQVAKDALKDETTQYKISNELTVDKH